MDDQNKNLLLATVPLALASLAVSRLGFAASEHGTQTLLPPLPPRPLPLDVGAGCPCPAAASQWALPVLLPLPLGCCC